MGAAKTGAFQTGAYPNIFAEIGVSQAEADERLADAFERVFFGAEGERIYHETPDGRYGFLVDTGNNDVRTEGQSYGMMIAAQLGRKDVFDRVWRWTKRHMRINGGANKGYFGWSAGLDGKLNSEGSAPDGEEYFAMALLFAHNRWGAAGEIDYAADAKDVLRAMVHNERPMFDPGNKLIKFVAEADFSDPSYHLPHFYELFALWGNPEDAPFFQAAAAESRAYLARAIHPRTGLSAEYAEYDGTPKNVNSHNLFYSDAYRTIANVAMDALWFGAERWHVDRANAIQRFFGEAGRGTDVFHIDGTKASADELVTEADGNPAGVLHPVGLLATLAQASIASDGEYRAALLRKFWDTPLREGGRRYYDNLLYIFALMALCGRYRVW